MLIWTSPVHDTQTSNSKATHLNQMYTRDAAQITSLTHSPAFTSLPSCHRRLSYANPIDLGLVLSLLRKVKVVAKPFAPQDLVDIQARVAICQGQEECPPKGGQSQNNDACDPSWDHAGACESFASRYVPLGPGNLRLSVLARQNVVFGRIVVEDKLKQSTCHQGGC